MPHATWSCTFVSAGSQGLSREDPGEVPALAWAALLPLPVRTRGPGKGYVAAGHRVDVSSVELSPLPDLTGRTALVTGASRGIGRAVAVDLVVAGAVVALVARSSRQLAETLVEIEAEKGAAAAFVRDLADVKAAASVLQNVERELGPVDILINNAATVAPLGPTQSVEPAEIEHSLRLNLISPVVLGTSAIPGMRQRGWGRIVNVSSGVVASPSGMIGANTYTFSKAALESHTVNLAAELEGSGVTANIYRPGRVDTSMQEWIRGQVPRLVGGGLVERFRSFHESGALITPRASARSLVVRLTSNETGRVWDVADELTKSPSS
ncbi:SDR family oxidoreductase [Nocardioides sp. YIM 152315]|uniref:SDR family NAD(P)-dependent oxidoreductase n=1 Tax=Nocardioides sp. YIM 152315 TaxID=3031760 RepID=UPI0023DABEA6|nr:SDR family oxidoreductase [Nocardioides sp. YIM 152315]MDF1603210.1 SDR family NAD(P)-dependent oxidoreductase [Nocardioides sp. YIM 152315]